MKEKDHLIKHGTIMLIATFFSGVFNYGFHWAMVRMLGPVDYGILFSLTSLFMIVSLPANTIQTVVSKYISGFNAHGESGKISFFLMRILRKISIVLGIALVVYIFLSRFIANYLNIPIIMPVILIGIILFFGILFPINFGALQGLERFTPFGIVQVVGAFTRIFFGVIFVLIGLGVNGALLGSLISALSLLAVTWWYLRDVWAVRPYDTNISKSPIYKYSIPVSISYIAYGVLTYIDVVIVKHYFDALNAGYYSTIAMIGKSFLFPPMAFAGALFPKVSSHHEKGLSSRHLLKKSLVYGGLICALGIAVCCIFTKPIMVLLIKEADLTESALNILVPLLRYVGFVVTPYGLACIVINYYLAKHWYGFLPYLVAGTILQIVLLYIFHASLIQVLTVLFVAGIFVLLCGVPGKLIERIKKKE
jgi:O-antigen/teichoic acid export membrane protein